MKTAFVAFAATASANLDLARECAQKVNLKIGEKVTWDPDCFNEQTSGLGCIEAIPGCRFCEFDNYQNIPCIDDQTFPSARVYIDAISSFEPKQNLNTQRQALRAALNERVPKVRAFLIERVQTPIRAALIERAKLMSEGKRAALRDVLMQRAPIRAALIERAALTGKQNLRAALIERAALLGSTELLDKKDEIISQAYSKYVMAFENIATHVAKPVSFDEFKAQPNLVSEVLHSQLARMALKEKMTETQLADMYAEYVQKFENVPNIKPKTYAVWKQNPRLLALELTVNAPLLASAQILRAALTQPHVRAALLAAAAQTHAHANTRPNVNVIRAALTQPTVRAALKERFPVRAALIERAALTGQVNLRQALIERAALLGSSTLMNMDEQVLEKAYAKYVTTFENIATHVAKPVDFETFKAQPRLVGEVLGVRQALIGQMNEEQLADMYAEYVRQFENVPNIKPKTFAVWKQNPSLVAPLIRAALTGQVHNVRQALLGQSIGQLSEDQLAKEYETYVKGFENIDTSQATPLTFPVWKQQQSGGHRRLTSYGGYGRRGGYGYGGYGRRGGFGYGGYGRRGGYGYGGGYGRGGYGRGGRHWG